MAAKSVTPLARERKAIAKLVTNYLDNRTFISLFQKSIVNAINESTQLRSLVHSVKYRMKDPEHLREKLVRKVKKRQRRKRAVSASH